MCRLVGINSNFLSAFSVLDLKEGPERAQKVRERLFVSVNTGTSYRCAPI